MYRYVLCLLNEQRHKIRNETQCTVDPLSRIVHRTIGVHWSHTKTASGSQWWLQVTASNSVYKMCDVGAVFRSSTMRCSPRSGWSSRDWPSSRRWMTWSRRSARCASVCPSSRKRWQPCRNPSPPWRPNWNRNGLTDTVCSSRARWEREGWRWTQSTESMQGVVWIDTCSYGWHQSGALPSLCEFCR